MHRAVEELPEERLAAAAELLEALSRHDEHVAAWRASLNAHDVPEIASSLRQVHAVEDWVSDEALGAWLESRNNDLAE